MTGKQGKPTPEPVIDFIVQAVTDCPSRTNATIKVMLTKEFRWAPTISTISRYRVDKELPSSRKANKEAKAKRSTQLTQKQRDHVIKLMDKFHLPSPDRLRPTDMISAVGEGKIGPEKELIYIRRIDKKLVECWLSGVEVKSLTGALSKMPGLQAQFSSVHEQGIRIIDDILGYNYRIKIGSGDNSFKRLEELLQGTKPESLNPYDRATFELWNRYISFGKTLANLKREFEKSRVIYSGKVQD